MYFFSTWYWEKWRKYFIQVSVVFCLLVLEIKSRSTILNTRKALYHWALYAQSWGLHHFFSFPLLLKKNRNFPSNKIQSILRNSFLFLFMNSMSYFLLHWFGIWGLIWLRKKCFDLSDDRIFPVEIHLKLIVNRMCLIINKYGSQITLSIL